MSHPVEVFENEEASKLLDYFVAYKKLMSKVEYIKCISALNNEVHFNETQIPAEDKSPPNINDEPLKIGLLTDLAGKP